MSTEFDRQKLEACLAKCIDGCGLRDILTQNGIPADETVMLHVKRDDEILVSQEIPAKSSASSIARQPTNFVEEIHDFLDRAETSDGLLSALPKSDSCTDGTSETLYKFIFDIGNFQFGRSSIETFRQQTVVAAGICCNPVCRICNNGC